MRRVMAGIVVAVALVAAGCSDSGSDKKHDAAPTTLSTPTTAASGATSTSIDYGTCGLSAVPDSGEVTWSVGAKLVAAAPGAPPHCLIDGLSAGPGLIQWNAPGDKAVIAGRLFTASGSDAPFTQPGFTVLSRPTGRSVLLVTSDGKLLKRDNMGEPKDISFLAKTEAAAYHPAGRTIVAGGVDKSGKHVLMVADNLGRNPRLLADGEKATGFHDLAFTASNALLFVAEHGDHADLHRLELETGKLTTPAESEKGETISHVVTSYFPGGGVAWQVGDCAKGTGKLVVEKGAKFLDVPSPAAARAFPVGWLADGSLAFLTQTTCSTDNAGDLYLFHPDRGVTLVAHDVGAAAVRAQFPEPVAPPADIPSQAPA